MDARDKGCRLGLDSHADMSCIGRHARILEQYCGRACNVQPFHDGYKAMENIATVNAAFAHDTQDGQTHILHVNQALDFTQGMEHSLLCPNQCRSNGVIVDDIPKCFDIQNKSTHSIIFPNEDHQLPLSQQGPISYLPVRYPSDEEMDFCLHFDLTSQDEWDPSMFTDIEGRVSYSALVCEDDMTNCQHTGNTFDEQLSHIIFVNAVSKSILRTVKPEDLAELWGISVEAATRTLKASTQEYIRILEGRISRRVKTKAHQRQYRQLGGYLGMFASDTFHSKVVSLRGNKYIQHFCNRGNYSVSYPMKSKAHAFHALDRFLHDVGIPSELLTDGAKELIFTEWGATCKRHKIHQNVTEPYSPWQNPAELSGGIIK